MASLVLSIKVAKDTTYYAKPLQARENWTRINGVLRGLSAGVLQGYVEVQTSTSDPIAAAGSIACVFASIANNDTVTIGGVTLTAVTGAPTAGQFQKVTDAPTTGANLAAAIAADPTLSQIVSASNNSGTVTVTSLVKGIIGNQIKMSTSNPAGFTLTQLAGGAGGPTGTALVLRGG